MRIVFATHEGVPLYGGGPSVKIRETRRYLQKLGVEVELFDMWNAREQLSKCDLVHLFGANFATYNLARNLRYQKIPFVVNPIFYTRRSARVLRIVNRIDQMMRSSLPGAWMEFGFTRDICAWSELVLPNTTDEGQIISQGLEIPPQKFQVIHNGVSQEFMDGNPTIFKKKYGLEHFILNVGHMGPARKNILRLVRALAKIDHPAVLITRILHTGETDQILQESKQNKNLLIIDGLPHNSPLLAAAFAACDVFVLPSQFETPGRAALEAALAGAKIVITPHGGTREYFQDFAEYVNPYAIEDICCGIETALNQPKNSILRDHVRHHFLWPKIAEDTFNVYQKILQI